MRHSYKWSITTQFCVVIIGLVTGTVLLCWFLNTTFLESYYSSMKMDQLVGGYDAIDQAVKEERLRSSEFGVELDRLCANGNIELLIIDSDGAVVRSSSNDALNLINRFLDVIFGASADKGRKEVASTDNYSVLQVTDRRIASEYLVLWGTLADGNLILMRTALEGIRASVDISNRFLAYIGIGLPDMSLGRLIYSAESAMVTPGWGFEFWSPVAIAIVISVVLYVTGQSLGDASDPRTHM